MRDIHSDLEPTKIVCRPDGGPVTFLDFASVGWGDAEWDLVTLCLDDPGRLPVVLRSYPDTGVIERVPAVADGYRIARRLALAHRTLSSGGDPRPNLSALAELA